MKLALGRVGTGVGVRVVIRIWKSYGWNLCYGKMGLERVVVGTRVGKSWQWC